MPSNGVKLIPSVNLAPCGDKIMQDMLFTERKNIKLNLRLPSRLNQELRRLAEMDCVSLNSAIVRLLAKGVREEVSNGS